MKKTYLLNGLCCANCAAKIERKAAALPGVAEASVNFLTTKLIVETEEGTDLAALKKAIERVVKKVEPDVDMVEA